MKKYVLVLLSVVSLFFVFDGSVGAQPGGLLDGKPMTMNSRGSGSTMLEYKATDNNPSTAAYVSYSDGVWSRMSYKVPSKTWQLNSFYIQTNGGEFYLYFLNSKNAVIASYRNPTNGSHSINLKNVASVYVQNENSNPMNIYEFDVFGTVELSIPVNVKAQVDTRAAVLNWDALPDSDLVGYNVYLDGYKVNSDLVTQNSYSFSDLVPDQSYSATVTAVYQSGDESLRSTAVTFKPYDDPISTIGLNVLSFVDFLKFSWNPDSKAVTYSVFDADSDLLISSGITASSYDLRGLEPNITRSVYVIGYDKYGRSVKSNIVSGTTKEPPAVIVPQVFVESKTHNTVNLRWNDSGVQYQVYKDGALVEVVGSNFYSFKDLEPESDHSFMVVATDIYNRVTPSNILSVKTLPLPDPYPLNVTISGVTSSSARISYSTGFTSYKVYLNGSLVKDSASTFYQAYDLGSETAYEVKVLGLDKYGRTIESNAVSFTTLKYVEPKPPEPVEPPPPVSNSGNPDLNNVNDHLVQGAKDSKNAALTLIPIILGILILVFGIWWLVRVFKKKMAKSTGMELKSSAGRPQVAGKPINAARPQMTSVQRNYKKQTNNNSNFGRKNYYVEKNYRSRYRGQK